MENKTFNVVGIGELLWDMLPNGKELGGAPANFAYHTKYLGANSLVISAVGDDEFGKEILSVLNKMTLDNAINIVKKPTGSVLVKLKKGIPFYEIQQDVAWDYIKLNPKVLSKLKKTDAICFGTLAQRSSISFEAINKAVNSVPNSALKIFDINLRAPFYNENIIKNSLNLANVLKLNDEELIVLSKMFNLKNTQEEACLQLIELFDLNLLALTNGAEGSMLFNKEEISRLSVPKIKVVDTIGAGDSFTAAMVMGILNKEPLKNIHNKAIQHAAKVCSYKGATPTIIK